jgi:signal transduction histidine kinase
MARSYSGAHGLERLAHTLRPGTTVEDVGSALAAALDDPSLQLVLAAGDGDTGWTDEAGRPREAPAAGEHTAVTQISADGGRIAAIVHDPVLSDDPAIVRAAGEIALLRLDYEQLVQRLTRSLADLQRSRARIVGVADRERREIERRLHDGAQQGLVGLRIRLSLLSERLAVLAPQEVDGVNLLGEQVEEAIQQVRALARGIYPPLLSQQGLGPALRAAARSAEIQVVTDVVQSRRYQAQIETAIYFTCMEAIQNALKHAHATQLELMLHDDGHEAEFEVRDDGSGFAGNESASAGMTNMRERIGAVGGELTVVTAPGAGTRVTGRVPLDELQE